MDAELKAKWVEALRSGKYGQGGGKLRSVLSDATVFCCLGVLCDVARPGGWRESTHELGTRDGNYLSHDGLDALGLNSDTQHRLARLNDDDGKSFAEIADVIEKTL